MTIRLLHCADLHQGLVTHSRPGAAGIPSAVLSTWRSWQRIADLAEELKPDAVLLAGDTFHVPNPEATALALFERELRRVHAPVVIIAGNHDRAPHPGQPCVLELFERPGRVWVSTRPEVFDIGPLIVGTLPSVSRHGLAALRDRPVSDAEVAQVLEDTLGKLQAADVLVAHWTVGGCVFGAERDVALAHEPIIPRVAIAEGPWRYSALGHLHRAQAFEDGPAAYAGSVDRVSFAEEHDAKVALEVELSERQVALTGEGDLAEMTGLEIRRHLLPARRFVTLSYQALTDDHTGTENDVAGAIVRMQGFPPSRARELRRVVLASGADVCYVQPAPKEARPPRNLEVAVRGAQPIDALEEWLRARETPEPERAELRAMASALAEGGPEWESSSDE